MSVKLGLIKYTTVHINSYWIEIIASVHVTYPPLRVGYATLQETNKLWSPSVTKIPIQNNFINLPSVQTAEEAENVIIQHLKNYRTSWIEIVAQIANNNK
jgi:hypothetical protein